MAGQPRPPANAPRANSVRLNAVESLTGRIPTVSQTAAWTPAEWQLYLENQVRPWDPLHCQELDARFHLSQSTNYEVLTAWLVLAAESGYEAVLPQVERVLGKVGRMKFLKPLYQALLARPETQPVARKCFERYARALPSDRSPGDCPSSTGHGVVTGDILRCEHCGEEYVWSEDGMDTETLCRVVRPQTEQLRLLAQPGTGRMGTADASAAAHRFPMALQPQLAGRFATRFQGPWHITHSLQPSYPFSMHQVDPDGYSRQD